MKSVLGRNLLWGFGVVKTYIFCRFSGEKVFFFEEIYCETGIASEISKSSTGFHVKSVFGGNLLWEFGRS